MTAPKKPAEQTELLPLLESTADERLFITCGCGHVAAYHADSGCGYVTRGSSSYSSSTPDVECRCSTPREVVYLGGREKAAS